MKNFHASFLYPLALVALSFAPAFAGGRQCLAEVTAQKQESQARVDQALQDAIDSAAKRKILDWELQQLEVFVTADSAIYVGAEGECLIAKRLEQELAELRARAQRYLVHVWEVQALQREIVLARLERAINELKARYKNGEIADDVFFMAMNTLQTDAMVWFESQGVTTIRERLQAAIFAITQAAADQVAVLHRSQAALLIVYEARLAAAAHTLKEHIAMGKATKQDYMRYDQLVLAFERLRKSFVPHGC